MRRSLALFVLIVLVALAHAPTLAVAQPVKGFPGMDTHRFAPHAGTSFLYAGRAQTLSGTNIGGAATMLQGDPRLATGDAHTLAELAVQSADLQQIVEIGWHVDALVNNDYWPRLFVFHWVNGQPTCYSREGDLCGWVQVSSTHRPGMRVQPGAMADYMIKREGTDWSIYYQGERMGYFPGSLWTNPAFTNAGVVQWFGEIAAAQPSSCSEMGNGVPGASGSAARILNMKVIPPSGTPVNANAAPGAVSNPALWSVGQASPTSFAFGGPGSGACCLPETCAEKLNECLTFADQCGTTRNCGPCDNGVQCTAQHTCASGSNLPPDGGVTGDDGGVSPDAGSPDGGGGGGGGGGDDDDGGGGESGGCCGAAGPAAIVPAFIIAPLIGLGRRRRRRVR